MRILLNAYDRNLLVLLLLMRINTLQNNKKYPVYKRRAPRCFPLLCPQEFTHQIAAGSRHQITLEEPHGGLEDIHALHHDQQDIGGLRDLL